MSWRHHGGPGSDQLTAAGFENQLFWLLGHQANKNQLFPNQRKQSGSLVTKPPSGCVCLTSHKTSVVGDVLWWRRCGCRTTSRVATLKLAGWQLAFMVTSSLVVCLTALHPCSLSQTPAPNPLHMRSIVRTGNWSQRWRWLRVPSESSTPQRQPSSGAGMNADTPVAFGWRMDAGCL